MRHKIVIAPNAFKECLSSPRVAEAMAAGVRAAVADAEVVLVPLADGGDGTMESLVSARKGTYCECTVHDPLHRKRKAQYGLIDDGRTAVIEMAAASGLWMLKEEEKDPLKTSTYGTGEMMRDAIELGAKRIIVGIGGSATVDGGMGMAAALGYRFKDSNNQELSPCGDHLRKIAKIDSSSVLPALADIEIYVACDVTNLLLGNEGAVAVYGPQKGATPASMPLLEEGLTILSERFDKDLHCDVLDLPGGGAAGGLGAGLVAFCGAELRSGLELVSEYAGLDNALKDATLVLTGEGKIDASTGFGKVPAGVARKAKAQSIPVVALAGAIDGDMALLHEQGVTAIFAIVNKPMSLQESMNQTEILLQQTVEQVVKLWQ